MDLPPIHADILLRFYTLLDELEDGLEGKRSIRQVSEYTDWPMRGVYLLFENGEVRSASAPLQNPPKMRVTRVGSHAIHRGAKSTLLGRLGSHRGPLGGCGNHRGSVLRAHVGKALLNSPDCTREVPTWNCDMSMRDRPEVEKELEARVTEYVGEMQLLWLSIDDKHTGADDRSYVERNLIALLSCGLCPVDTPSASWLGRNHPEPAIVKSGLWNIHYVRREYRTDFLWVLEGHVRTTIHNHSRNN